MCFTLCQLTGYDFQIQFSADKNNRNQVQNSSNKTQPLLATLLKFVKTQEKLISCQKFIFITKTFSKKERF